MHLSACVCNRSRAPPGDCLLDPPEQTLSLPAEPPGHVYGLDRQCQQVFGEDFGHCPDAQEVCSQLWCREEGQLQCTTRNGSLPWADGTPCGEDGHCLRGVCMNNTEGKLEVGVCACVRTCPSVFLTEHFEL